MSFKLGKILINGNVVLAPMAGVTNIAYRKMCKSFGAAMVTSEMISDKGIYYKDKKTKELAKIDDIEHPIAIQIFGADIDTLVEAAKWVESSTDADIIDINMGCSVPKITKENAGSCYLKDPERIYKTVKAVVDSISLPVTCKIRIGWDKSSINAIEVVGKIKEAGAVGVAIHGRTKSDLYSGEVDYKVIKDVKEAYPDFTIIANGDIKDVYKAKEVLEYTKADAIMIGRASYGNPYIFTQINKYLEDGTILPDMDLKERIKILKEYANDLINYKGEYIAIKELRGQAGWFIKGCKGGASIRNTLTSIKTKEELFNILDNIEEN